MSFDFGSISDTITSFGTWQFVISVSLAVAFMFFVVLFIITIDSSKVGFRHILTSVVAGIILAVVAQYYTDLFDWLESGFSGSNLGVAMYSIGLLSMVVVMIWNLSATHGKRLVR